MKSDYLKRSYQFLYSFKIVEEPEEIKKNLNYRLFRYQLINETPIYLNQSKKSENNKKFLINAPYYTCENDVLVIKLLLERFNGPFIGPVFHKTYYCKY